MINEKIEIISVDKLQPNIYLMKAYAPKIASEIKPSQFCNIKVSETDFPLLRRPFSVCDVEEDNIFFMFDVHGEGTRILSEKNKGDILEVLGPLGSGFNLSIDFKRAVIVAGGLGAAPFPFLTKQLNGKEIYSYVGGRNKGYVVEYGLENVRPATDDGSYGFHGNIIQRLEVEKEEIINDKSVIFACGPTPMLRALQNFALKNKIRAQLSTECAMACGFGICQGCPVHSSTEDKYLLVCKDGPVFEAGEVEL